MKEINKYIIEKLRINKDTDSKESWSELKRKIKKEFENEESKMTLKFLISFIKKSKNGPYNDSMFNYWSMGIKGNSLTCQHSGWSSSRSGFGKVKYIETVIDNYNRTHGTKIKSEIAGSLHPDYAGIPILHIEEVVDALKKKYPDFEQDPEKELISIDYE